MSNRSFRNGEKRTLYSVYPTTTTGVPAAHAFGLSSTSDGLGLVQTALQHLKSESLGWTPFHPERLPYPMQDVNESIAKWQRLSELSIKVQLREHIVHAQALSVITLCFVSELVLRLQGSNAYAPYSPVHSPLDDTSLPWITQLLRFGFLIGWESLISAQGKELAMLQDANGALKALARCKFHLCADPEKRGGGGAAVSIKVEENIQNDEDIESAVSIYIPRADFDAFCIEANEPDACVLGPIQVIPLLFSQGINEFQTLANVASRVSDTTGNMVQRKTNERSFSILNQYFGQVYPFLSSVPQTLAIVERDLERLRITVATEQAHQKDVDILTSAADLVRSLRGGRVTFCKSGKDRTAMSVTLEQSRLLHLDWNQNLAITDSNGSDESISPSEVILRTANLFREKGIRLIIAEKNIGRAAYSFNGLQRKMLPYLYRPPTSTLTDIYTSVRSRDS